jgi:hypothetical protein
MAAAPPFDARARGRARPQEEGLDPERLSRTYAALMAELQEVAGMGVNAVELTPATLAPVLPEGEEEDEEDGHTDDVRGVSAAWDGRLAASCSFDKTVGVWDLVTGQEVSAMEGHTDKEEEGDEDEVDEEGDEKGKAQLAELPEGLRALAGEVRELVVRSTRLAVVPGWVGS